jgi:rubredoxin
MSVTEETQAQPHTAKWICETCGFVYDPQDGDPDGDIDPGTPFEDVPDDWMCPICGARKRDFRKLEPGEEIPDEVD